LFSGKINVLEDFLLRSDAMDLLSAPPKASFLRHRHPENGLFGRRRRLPEYFICISQLILRLVAKIHGLGAEPLFRAASPVRRPVAGDFRPLGAGAGGGLLRAPANALLFAPFMHICSPLSLAITFARLINLPIGVIVSRFTKYMS